MVAVFFTFSVIGFYVDLSLTSGQMPFAVVGSVALISGLNAGLWIIVLARSSRLVLFVLIAAQFFTSAINTAVANWEVHTFNPPPVSSQTGIQFAATAVLCAVIASYIFFVSYIRIQGMETFPDSKRTRARPRHSKNAGSPDYLAFNPLRCLRHLLSQR